MSMKSVDKIINPTKEAQKELRKAHKRLRREKRVTRQVRVSLKWHDRLKESCRSEKARMSFFLDEICRQYFSPHNQKINMELNKKIDLQDPNIVLVIDREAISRDLIGGTSKLLNEKGELDESAHLAIAHQIDMNIVEFMIDCYARAEEALAGKGALK